MRKLFLTPPRHSPDTHGQQRDIWKAGAATMTDVGSLSPLTKSYTPMEKVGYWRRHYRRGYYSYGYPGERRSHVPGFQHTGSNPLARVHRLTNGSACRPRAPNALHG
jgi:hypothetical protein